MNVTKIVVGLPLNMDGSKGEKAKEIYAFVEKLKELLSVPIQLWDERLTTLEANRILLQADMSRKKRKNRAGEAYSVSRFWSQESQFLPG